MQYVSSHTGIGKVVYTKRAQSRTIKISVSRSRGVRVSLPLYSSYAKAVEFVEANLEKIRTILSQQEERARQAAGAEALERGRYREDAAFGNGGGVSGNDGGILGSGELPGGAGAVFPPRRLCTVAELEEIRRRAHRILPHRLAELSEKLNATILVRDKQGVRKDNPFSYNRLAIKDNRTNWGSCSSIRNINLNMHLVNLPAELMDFVILHELCHLVYPNHGARFHSLVDLACNGSEKELSRRLKTYRPGECAGGL